MRVFLYLLILSASLLPTFANADFVALDKVAVVVDESIIMQSDINKRAQDIAFQFKQRKTALPPDDIFRKQIIEQLIIEMLQKNLAIRAGVRLDDKEVNATITNIAQKNGATLAAFQQKLDSTEGTSYAEVRDQIKQEMLIGKLRQQRMQDRIRITDQDVQNFLRSPAGKAELSVEYNLGHILISLPEAPTPKDIADAEEKVKKVQAELSSGQDFAKTAATYSNAETALQGGDIGWRPAAELPTLFADKVQNMKAGDVAPAIRTSSGFHIIKLLGKRGGEEMKVPQWQVRHILIKPTEILSSDDAKQKLNDIRDKILKGASFSDQARIISDDPGSARQGGSLGWVSAGEMVPEFDAVMQKQAEKKVSDVFQSSFGWHILEVTGSRIHDVSEQYRANLARQALYAREYDEELATWLRELRTDAFVEIRQDAI